MEQISRLLLILQPSPATVTDVEAILQEFQALTDSEKDVRRLTTAEAVFPLVFSDDASLRADSTFPKRNNTVWLDDPNP